MGWGHGLDKPRSFLLSHRWKHIPVSSLSAWNDWFQDKKWDWAALRDKKQPRWGEKIKEGYRWKQRKEAKCMDAWWFTEVFDLTERVTDVWGKLWKRWFVRGCDEWNFTVHVPARIGYLWLQTPHPDTCEAHPKWSWQEDLKPWPVCKHMHVSAL